MGIGGLVSAHPTHVEAVWDSFSGGENTNFIFNYFEVSNERIIGKEAEMRGSAVKFWAPKLVMKMEEKTKQKQGGSGVGDTMKVAWNVGSVKTRKRCCGEVKNFQGCCSFFLPSLTGIALGP